MKKNISAFSFFIPGLLFAIITGLAIAKTVINFPDVKSTDWFYNDVNNMVDWGAIQGNTDGTFKPGNNVNRAELAAMWNRYNTYLKTQFVPKTTVFPTVEKDSLGKLEILSHSLKQETYWEINGEVQNNSASKKDFVKISATFYDKNDKVVDSAFSYTNPSSLEAGQKAPFKITIIKAIQNYDHYTVQVAN